MVATLAAGRLAADAPPPPADVRAADALAQQGPSKDRDRALAKWARGAGLAELMFVLRLPGERLGATEADLAQAALRLAPETRAALRARLEARIALARGRSAGGGPWHPRASVFRIATMLPDSGDYGAFGRAVLSGVAVGVDAVRGAEAAGETAAARALLESAAAAALPIAVDTLPAPGDPGAMLASFDAAGARSGAFVGELLSVPTMILGTAARYTGVPLVSPTATDENAGAVAPQVFQVGPSGTGRAEALARVAVVAGKRVAILVSSAFEDAFFARAFAAAAARRGGSVVWRETYAAGNADFREHVRALKALRVDLLFWDGEAREADALLRQLARDQVTMAVCGGPALDPEQHHAEVRLLLEGVTYAGEEWRLRDPVAAALDRLGVFDGEDSPQRRALWVRGFLAGHALRAAVEQGALCPEEIFERLAARAFSEPRGLGFLDFGTLVDVPVLRVERGTAIAVQ